MPSAYLNIGSNRGDRRRFIDRAIALVGEAWPVAVVRTAPPMESPAWGYESENTFLNVGIALDFPSAAVMPSPPAMLRTLQQIERTVSADSPHRNADGTYRDRDIDIDIIDIDGVTMDTDELTVPHPRADARRFVTVPMQFLCPGWTASRGTVRLKKNIADLGRDTVEHFRAKPKTPVTVVLDNIRSLNNIGSIFRTADAFMLDSVVLCGISATPPDPAIHKTALGAEESVAWHYFDTTAEAVASLRAQGWTICCLEQVHGSVDLDAFVPAPGQKIALVSGNEVAGVDPAIVRGADVWLEIPQAGTKHSLNVAVSTAIALWHLYSHLSRR